MNEVATKAFNFDSGQWGTHSAKDNEENVQNKEAVSPIVVSCL